MSHVFADTAGKSMNHLGRTVVLGGTGYLGTAISLQLSHAGPVTVVSRRSPTIPHADHVRADLTDPLQVRDAVYGADTVIYAAGYSTPERQWRLGDLDGHSRQVNVDSIAAVITTLENSPRHGGLCPLLVAAGSIAVHYDDSRHGYAAQKREVDEMLAEAGARDIIQTVSLQLSTVYGETGAGAGNGLVASWAHKALQGEPLHIWNDGETLRDLVHVEDAARAFAAATRCRNNLNPSYQIGSGTGLSLSWIAGRVVEAAARHHGPRSVIKSSPAPAHAAPSDLRSVTTDPANFRADTGWRPRVDAAEGIDRLIHTLASAPIHLREKS